MDKKELRQLSKGQLIEIIFDLKRKIEEFEHLLKAFDNPHTPSSKKRSKQNTQRDETQNRFPGKPKGSNGGGIQMPQPDKEELVRKDSCPECGKRLGKPYGTYKFRQMDIPEPKFITTQYIVELYKCRCGAEVDAGEELQKGYYGPKITALLGCLKDECLSHGAIANFLQSVYTLPITNVTIYNKLIRLACLMRSEREQIRSAINEGDHATMDETGLRKDGRNGHVWNVSTDLYCLFEYDKSRGAEVAKRMLNHFSGALVTDDYKGYHWHTLHQLCWAHLLREAEEFAEKYDGAKAQHKRLKALYDKARRGSGDKGFKQVRCLCLGTGGYSQMLSSAGWLQDYVFQAA